MSKMPENRTVEESIAEMTEIVLPEDTNHRGSIFGGRVLALVDKCAAVVAIISLVPVSVPSLITVSIGPTPCLLPQ